MQLERMLQSQGFGSRKECRSLIRHGLVTVAGTLCDDPFADIEPAGCEFTVDDEPWLYRAQVYLALNKPAGFECSHQPQHHRSVFSLLLEPLVTRGVQCVGRLDEDTTGLLLLSDDGQFIHTLSSPKRKVSKVYEVQTKHAIDASQIDALLAGVVLHDDPAPVQAVACEQLGERSLRLTIAEGRYHQVKRMIAAAGNRVEALKRTAVGGFSLPAELGEGQWCWLDAADLELLRPAG
jgi:16S rRNA pseudouridine516 synthase